MGTYRAKISNSTLIRLQHEGPDDHVLQIQSNTQVVPEWIQSSVKEGKRYVISLGFTEQPEAQAS